MSLVRGFEAGAEPPYTPLGFAPYEIGPDGQSEFSKTMDAIDLAFDRYQGDLPDHVRTVGKAALYAELSKQALRNNAPGSHAIEESAKQAKYTPGQLLELMMRSSIVRASEIGRYTDLGQVNASQNIHAPVRNSLLHNKSLQTVELDSKPYFKNEPAFVTDELIAVEVKQRQMEHLHGQFVTSSRILFLVDMLDKRNPARDDIAALEPVALGYVEGQEERPQWLLDALSTYYTVDVERLKGLEPNHRDLSPNAPIWQRPTSKSK